MRGAARPAASRTDPSRNTRRRAFCESRAGAGVQGCSRLTVDPIKLETGLRPNSTGIPYTLLLRIKAMGFQLFGFYCTGFRASGSSGFGQRRGTLKPPKQALLKPTGNPKHPKEHSMNPRKIVLYYSKALYSSNKVLRYGTTRK